MANEAPPNEAEWPADMREATLDLAPYLDHGVECVRSPSHNPRLSNVAAHTLPFPGGNYHVTRLGVPTHLRNIVGAPKEILVRPAPLPEEDA